MALFTFLSVSFTKLWNPLFLISGREEEKAVQQQLQNAMLRKQTQQKHILTQAVFFLLERGCLLLTEPLFLCLYNNNSWFPVMSEELKVCDVFIYFLNLL